MIERFVSPIQTHVCHEYHAYKYKLRVVIFFSCHSFLYLHFLLPVCMLHISCLWCLSPFNSTCVSEFLNIYLIDVVSGSVVFSVSHKRAREPVHIVHSENWLLYSYFSDKSRRTEIVTLELYEGKVQSNTTGKTLNTVFFYFNTCTVHSLLFVNQPTKEYIPGRHNSSINTQIVYTATLQTSCNSNHFIILDNFNVLKTLLILARAAIVLM